jgi:hypothetical protein
VCLPWGDLAGQNWSLTGRLGEYRFSRAGDELAREGSCVALEGWASRLLALEI